MCYAIVIFAVMLVNPATEMQEPGLRVFAAQIESRDWPRVKQEAMQSPNLVHAKCYPIA